MFDTALIKIESDKNNEKITLKILVHYVSTKTYQPHTLNENGKLNIKYCDLFYLKIVWCPKRLKTTLGTIIRFRNSKHKLLVNGLHPICFWNYFI